MSDGPHRSLNMTRSWKRVAERSDKRSYSSEEVTASFAGALEKDCRREINPGFIDAAWRIFSDPEPSLFVIRISDQLEALRRQAGSGIGRSMLDHAILCAERGKTGQEGLVEAVKNALADRGAKAIRQIQEHYCRESSNPRADRIKTRLEESMTGTALEGLAKSILNVTPAVTRPALKSGLDDGVMLR